METQNMYVDLIKQLKKKIAMFIQNVFEYESNHLLNQLNKVGDEFDELCDFICLNLDGALKCTYFSENYLNKLVVYDVFYFLQTLKDGKDYSQPKESINLQEKKNTP